MLRLIIADAELELIPKKMLHDPSIRKIASKNHKNADEMLLDSNYMHSSIDKYFPGKSNRFGRPDIIYIFLEMAMESILNKNKLLDVYIHTKNNFIININPEVNVPKSYNRFTGLIEDLFRKKIIENNGKTLLSLHDGELLPFLEKLDGKTIVLSPGGNKSKISEIINADTINVVIGGFSEGDFITNLYEKYNAYSIFNKELTIWSAGMEVIAEYERFKLIVD